MMCQQHVEVAGMWDSCLGTSKDAAISVQHLRVSCLTAGLQPNTNPTSSSSHIAQHRHKDLGTKTFRSIQNNTVMFALGNKK